MADSDLDTASGDCLSCSDTNEVSTYGLLERDTEKE